MYRLGDPNMPGRGDPETWGPISGPDDPRYHDDSDLIDELADEYFDKFMTERERVVDAVGWLSIDEIGQIADALMAKDQAEAGRLMSAAIARVIGDEARDEAQRQIERMEDESIADYCRERMED